MQFLQKYIHFLLKKEILSKIANAQIFEFHWVKWSSSTPPLMGIYVTGLYCGQDRYWTNWKFWSECWFASKICIVVGFCHGNRKKRFTFRVCVVLISSYGTNHGWTVWMCSWMGKYPYWQRIGSVPRLVTFLKQTEQGYLCGPGFRCTSPVYSPTDIVQLNVLVIFEWVYVFCIDSWLWKPSTSQSFSVWRNIF